MYCLNPIQEGVTLSLDEDDIFNFIPNVPDNEKENKNYQETFKKVIKERIKKEKIKKQQTENPFLDNESIFGEFVSPLKNEENMKKYEEFAKKLFA